MGSAFFRHFFFAVSPSCSFDLMWLLGNAYFRRTKIAYCRRTRARRWERAGGNELLPGRLSVVGVSVKPPNVSDGIPYGSLALSVLLCSWGNSFASR
jgi:hypothetical protein